MDVLAKAIVLRLVGLVVMSDQRYCAFGSFVER